MEFATTRTWTRNELKQSSCKWAVHYSRKSNLSWLRPGRWIQTFLKQPFVDCWLFWQIPREAGFRRLLTTMVTICTACSSTLLAISIQRTTTTATTGGLYAAWCSRAPWRHPPLLRSARSLPKFMSRKAGTAPPQVIRFWKLYVFDRKHNPNRR